MKGIHIYLLFLRTTGERERDDYTKIKYRKRAGQPNNKPQNNQIKVG
jgi:hypothetical protein